MKVGNGKQKDVLRRFAKEEYGGMGEWIKKRRIRELKRERRLSRVEGGREED